MNNLTRECAAFTLAEVLITLGVIGIAAAVTLSVVINNIQEKQFHAKFKKAYSSFSQATQRIYAEDGEFSTYQYTIWGEYICKLGNYMKIIKSGQKCENKYPSVKWHNNLEWFDKKGNPMSFATNPYYRDNFTFITSDGIMYILNCDNQVLIDINGFKKPNRIGKDIYYFLLKSNTNQPYYGSDNIVPDCYSSGFTRIKDNNYKEDCKSGSGWGCSRMVINNEL